MFIYMEQDKINSKLWAGMFGKTNPNISVEPVKIIRQRQKNIEHIDDE